MIHTVGVLFRGLTGCLALDSGKSQQEQFQSVDSLQGGLCQKLTSHLKSSLCMLTSNSRNALYFVLTETGFVIERTYMTIYVTIYMNIY